MFVSFFFNILYQGDCYHWYLDTLNYAYRYNYPLITSDDYAVIPYATHYLTNISSQPKKHELDRNITEAERGMVEQYFIPSEVLRGDRQKISWTEHSLELLQKRNEALEGYLESILKEILEKHPGEKFEGFLFFCEAYESVRFLADKYGCPVITYELSAIRTDVGYMQTLICANLDGRQYGSSEGKNRYECFCKESKGLPFFTRKELIALFGRESTLPLLPLIECEPAYEIGVCGYGQNIVPTIFACEKYTDDDLKADCDALYPLEKRLWRQHRGYLSHIELLESRLDPEFFILSCRRIAAVGSNIVTEAMLWNRTACCKTNIMSFSFMCEKDFDSDNKVSEQALNYQFFGLFVPGYKNLFDPDYWRWRLNCSSESEVYLKHMYMCLENSGLKADILKLSSETRLKKILDSRGLHPIQIEQMLMSFNDTHIREIDFRVLSSCAELTFSDAGGNTTQEKYWSRNRFSNGLIYSEFIFENLKNGTMIRFIPLLDIAGFVAPEKVLLDDKVITAQGYSRAQSGLWYDYMPKFGAHGYTIYLNKDIEIAGRTSLIFTWKYIELGEQRYYELASEGMAKKTLEHDLVSVSNRLLEIEKTFDAVNAQLQSTENELKETNTKLQLINDAFESVNAQLQSERAKLQSIENSNCWKITKPLRALLDSLKRYLR